ncbi:hypothetical protein [uncultured Desulfosarcina sp.]|nr:hypothetical protein [uncultured Desulfosarcina sp.]
MSISSECKKEIGREDAAWQRLVARHGSRVDVSGYALLVDVLRAT